MKTKDVPRTPRIRQGKPPKVRVSGGSAARVNGGKHDSSVPAAPRGAVERSLRLMEVLIELAGPTGLPRLAQLVGLETNTAHRLLERLVATGYARKCGATKRYSAAARALVPMSLHHPLNRLRLEAREQLRLLRERHDESVCLILFVGRQRVIIDFIPGREPLSPLYETWLSNPLHASAAGIVLLSGYGDAERRTLLGPEPFVAPTANTITSYSQLDAEFAALAADGYAVARQTTFVGVYAVAAPIRGPHGPIGCLALTGSAYGKDEPRLAVLGESLKDAAHLISFGAPSIKAVGDYLGDAVPEEQPTFQGTN